MTRLPGPLALLATVLILSGVVLSGAALSGAAPIEEPAAEPSAQSADTRVARLPDAATTATPNPGTPPAVLGMNLDTPTFWSTNWVFGDVMQQAQYNEAAKAWLVFWDSDQYPRAGFIVVPRRGARVVDTGDGLKIKAPADARDRGLQVWLPQAIRDELFHPTYLERLRPFKVLRFMDWLDTNNSPVVTWEDRAHHSVPIPYMVELSNALDADPWFCMPHKADDDYVRQFAELVKATLEPDRKIYLEYSNECWNAQFEQHRWLVSRNGGENPMQQAGREAKRDFAIWYEVFGDEAPKRLVRVAAGQAANPWQIEQMIEAMGTEPRGFDAISCAAYAGISVEEARALPPDATAEDIIALARRQWRARLPKRAEHAALAKEHGVSFIAYEGGQHISPYGRTVEWMGAFRNAQQHPAMYELYLEMLRDFERIGGTLFVAFNDVRRIDRNGAWGHLEYQNQPIEQAPKYRALLDYAAGTAASQAQ